MGIQLQKLHKGIDNAHIDITLSPVFIIRATRFVRGILQHDAAIVGLSSQVPKPKKADTDAFIAAYSDMVEAAIKQARQTSSPEQIQLLQLGVIRFLVTLIDNELTRLHDSMQRNRGGVMGRSSGRALELHERVVILAKVKTKLRNAVLHQCFTQIIKQEKRTLRMLRKSVLGISWPLPKRILCNPMLQQPLPWGADQRVESYLPLCAEHFAHINRLITEVFVNYLPNWAVASDEAVNGSHEKGRLKKPARLHKPLSGVDGCLEAETLLRSALQPEEYLQGQFSWLDMPENIARLTSPTTLQTTFNNQPQKEQLPAGWQRFQQQLRKNIYQQFKRSNFIPLVLAAYETRKVMRELDKSVPISVVQQYLAEGLSRKELFRHFAELQIETASIAAIGKKLDLARGQIKQLQRYEQEQLLLDFIKDFLVFRRDLKNAFLTYQAMDQLSILNKPEDIELSNANGKLYQFATAYENDPIKQPICKHVIIKADIRGSTSMTTGLVAKGLNPATYFSLNLFKPINDLLDSYGAAKVFVEGDAIILSILEHENIANQRLSVAWACGLAQKILEVVDVQNIKNEQFGLPSLELGLGIAFSRESPAYLYDDEKKIMISSAINRADQLSSCSAVLRRSCPRERGVEVMTSVDLGMFEKEHPERLLRFNVDGIELDSPAFDKLKTELKLKRLIPDELLACDATALYVGRYPDNKGVKHWLVVREAPVRFWADSCIGPEEQKGRCFYEVLVDREVLAWVKTKMNLKQQKQAVDISAVQSEFPADYVI